MKKNLSLKREQNRLASENAIKDEECYFYDKEYPLVINTQLKQMTSFNSLMPRTVRIEFSETVDNMKNQPFVIDLYTSLSLEELEKRLKICKNERDIEDIE